MTELRLTYQELKRYSSQLMPEQFKAGIQDIGVDEPATSTQFRWELMGHHIILAKVKLYCLQELHITLDGYDAISESSIAELYGALYHRFVGMLPRMMTSQPVLQRQRVDRLLGFIRFVHPGLLSQFITADLLKSSVRRLLPADEMLRRYVKKNGGIMQRTVTPSSDGSHVRLIYRFKDAVGTGRTLDEAVTMASERMADILYDGDLPTIHETFPQQTRTSIPLNSNMRVWGQPFGVADDIVSRILGFDQVNQSMDQLIESIGSNLSAIYYFNREMKLIDHQDAGKRVVRYVDHLTESVKIAAAPYLIPLGQARPTVKRGLVYRMFFYLNPLGMPINPEFEKLLQADLSPISQVVQPTAPEKIKIKPSERVVTSVFKPEPVKPVVSKPTPTPVKPASLQPTPIPVNQSTAAVASKPIVKATVGEVVKWVKLEQFSDMVTWVNQTKLPYTTLLSLQQNPIAMFQEMLKPDHAVTLTLVLPQLDRQKLKVVVPLIKSALAIPNSRVILYTANAEHVLEEQPVGDITPMTILALLKRGLVLRQMDDEQAQGQLIELVVDQMVIDHLIIGDITMIGTVAQALPGQVTVAPLDQQPMGWWLQALAGHCLEITEAKLARVLLDERLKKLGF